MVERTSVIQSSFATPSNRLYQPDPAPGLSAVIKWREYFAIATPVALISCGSFLDIGSRDREVRFTPESGRRQADRPCRLCATSRSHPDIAQSPKIAVTRWRIKVFALN
jgi:hypothetical protein